MERNLMNLLKHYLLFLSTLLLITSCENNDKTTVINFAESDEVKFAIEELGSELPKDWSSYEFLTFDIFASSTQRFTLTLHDAEGPRRIVVLPFENTWVRASIPLIHFKERNVVGHDMAAI